MDLYINKEPISINPPINFDDLWYIRKYLCSDLDGNGGNTILLPMDSEWTKLFIDQKDIYQPHGENLRRHVLFTVDKIDFNKIISFGTDFCWHKSSVLLYSDVLRIQKCISIIHLLNNNCIIEPDYLIDPISHQLLNNPYIASDGITYSYSSLWKLFNINNNPVSPLTRESLIQFNGKIGIKNILVSNLVNNFIEEIDV